MDIINPKDKQVFIDSNMVRWIYDKELEIWKETGTSETIMLATETTDGLMSAIDKINLDKITTISGGFGIITDTKLLLKTDTNYDGVITGDIILKSDTLDIYCISNNEIFEKERGRSSDNNTDEPSNVSSFTTISNACGSPIEIEKPYSSEVTSTPVTDQPQEIVLDESMPGLKFILKDEVLQSIIINAQGPKGYTGKDGNKGPRGDDAYSYTPKGKKGKKGKDVINLKELSGIEFNDISGVSDTAIIGLRMHNDTFGSHLVTTKSQLNIIDNQPADRIIARPLIRDITYANDDNCGSIRLKDFTISKAAGDDTPTDLTMVRLSQSEIEPVVASGSIKLSDFVKSIVNDYEDKLAKIDEKFGDEVKTYIEGVDKSARSILSSLTNELTMCEFNLPAVEYCITFDSNCGDGGQSDSSSGSSGPNSSSSSSRASSSSSSSSSSRPNSSSSSSSNGLPDPCQPCDSAPPKFVDVTIFPADNNIAFNQSTVLGSATLQLIDSSHCVWEGLLYDKGPNAGALSGPCRAIIRRESTAIGDDANGWFMQWSFTLITQFDTQWGHFTDQYAHIQQFRHEKVANPLGPRNFLFCWRSLRFHGPLMRDPWTVQHESGDRPTLILATFHN